MADPQRAKSRARIVGTGGIVVIGLGALAITVGAGVMRGATAPTIELTPQVSMSAAAESETYVHVSGAVRAPGLYRLDTGSRIVDAVAAAGGFADDADRAALNLARRVADGEQLVVPVSGSTPPAGAPPAASGGDGRVNLNTADVTQLDTLSRIGPAIAQRIVDWRTQNGSFGAVDDLLDVPGIGEKLLDGIRDRVTV